LLDFAIHCRQNDTRSRKSTHVKTCVHSAMLHGRLMLAEVWPWPPLWSPFTEAVRTITVRELSYKPITVHYSTHWAFSVCCVFTRCRLVTLSNAVDSSSVFHGSRPRWLLFISQLTRRCYATAYNGG
jgi:hypothetical protein